MEQQTFDEYKNREFFKHLVKAYKKHEKKEKAKKRLDSHLEKVKELSSNKKFSKKKIELEFKMLEKRISEVIELEKGIINRGEEKNLNKEVKKRLNQLEKNFDNYTEKIEGREKKVKELEKKIKDKITIEKEPAKENDKRSRSDEVLERPIAIKEPLIKDTKKDKGKSEKKKKTKEINYKKEKDKAIELKHKLFDLEEAHYNLKSEGVPKHKLKKIKTKIKKLKEKI